MQRRFLALVFVLILADLLTKIAAYLCLSLGHEIPLCRSVSLYLTVNELGLGSRYRKLFGENQTFQILGSVVSIVMAPCFVLLHGCRWRLWLKVVTAVLIAAAMIHAARFISSLWHLVNLNSWSVQVFQRMASLPPAIVLFALSGSRYFRFTWGLGLACNIGNALSLFYPPFRVVDFIYIKPASDGLGIGVFNFADVCSDLSIALVVFSPIYFLLVSAKRRLADRMRIGDVARDEILDSKP